MLARRTLLLTLLALTLMSGACRRAEPPAARETRLVVFAAASLREVFTNLGRQFEAAHPGVTLSFNFAGTQELRAQVEHGAVVDVFASADQRHMQELVRAERVTQPVVFARNEPVIVVSREAAGRVRSLAELPEAARIVLGAPEVPIGRYGLQIFERARATLGADFPARIEAKVVSRELNVRQVLTKVSLGEAEAGLVYRTDALAAGEGVTVVTLPPALNVVADYPIAVVMGAPQPELARSWVDFVRSPEGQRALRGAGFVPVSTDAAP